MGTEDHAARSGHTLPFGSQHKGSLDVPERLLPLPFNLRLEMLVLLCLTLARDPQQERALVQK